MEIFVVSVEVLNNHHQYFNAMIEGEKANR